MAGSESRRVHSIFKVKAEGRARLIIFDTQDLSLGRSPENDLAFDDPEMSRKHAVFVRTAGGCLIKDLGTPNGTGVNEDSVDHATLKRGDVVRIGEVEITYAETTRDPASLGPAVEYASQLKAFAVSLPEGDGEVTMLGTERASEPGFADSEFDAALDLLGSDEVPALGEEPPRDLDAELADLGSEMSLSPAEPAEELVAPGHSLESSDAVWELDDSESGLGSLDLGSPPGTGSLVLRIELDGLEGELRSTLEGLAGKLIELPRLRVKVETGD